MPLCQLAATVAEYRHQLMEGIPALMIAEAAVTGATLALTHVTYLNTYRDRPIEEWPHARALAKTGACVSTTWRAWRVFTFLVRHHGRWFMWQVATLLPSRTVVREGDEE